MLTTLKLFINNSFYLQIQCYHTLEETLIWPPERGTYRLAVLPGTTSSPLRNGQFAIDRVQ